MNESESAKTTDDTFHGVFEYAGNNSAADAGNPDLAGVDLDYYWSQIEPQKGVYDWSIITSAMAPWVANGKKVILRIATAGQAGWDPPYSGSGTPGWVYTDGAASVTDSGEILPVYWNATYLRDLSTFLAAYAAEFNGNKDVALVEAGVGMGGETEPENNLSATGVATWEAAGYNPATWLSTVETISTMYRDAFTQTPVYAMLTSTFLGGDSGVTWTDYQDLAAWYTSASPPWGLQNNALSATSTLPDPTAWADAAGLVLEQGQPTSRSGDTLATDAANALATHAGYVLIYKSDVDNAGYAATLAQLASITSTMDPPPASTLSGSSGSSGSSDPQTSSNRTRGYWLTGGDGGVFAFGGAPFYGSTGALHLAQPIVGMTATPDGKGYWFVARDGGIFSLGDAHFSGSVPSVATVDDVVGVAASTGGGYWVETADGHTYAFGGAPSLPALSTLGVHVDNVVGIAATANGGGAYLVATDGGVYALGDAVFRGSMGGQRLNQPIVGIALDPATGGYWEVAADGGIFAFHAPFEGSTGSLALTKPIVGMATTTDGRGYRLVASDGGIFAFGDATFQGSLPSIGVTPVSPVVGMAAV